jgi:hypothetical protein
MPRKRTAPPPPSMFQAGEDLPLFTGEAPRAPWRGEFKPRDYTRQESLFDIRPRIGQSDPTYTPNEEI